ncbi:pyridoxal phosphate-dependent aminotransferase [Sphingomonas sp.]|uniref:pyridoxal phosphate-dependent aminotransferase n=1 Tax=Sphingomonas sp. TaxID=28214 RepID=UPI0025EF41BD|nr:pyridoxal phosphate-dependent aminotransferase [Sphingomonas sp.]
MTNNAAYSRLNPHMAGVRRVDYAALQDRIDAGYLMLGWADPFFPDPCLPEHVIAAAKATLDEGGAHYSLPIGSPQLRRTIAGKLARVNGMSIDPDRELIVTPGSDTGLWQAMQVVISPGDEVLNPVPSYPSNVRNVELMGGVNVPVPLDAERDFALDLDALRQRITPSSKLIVLTQPNNPTGTVHDRATLEALAKIVIDHDLLVVVDQAFEDVIYDGREFVTFATLPGMRERTITVFSLSKGMAMSGFRIGYTVAAPEIMAIMHGTAVNILGAANTAAQAAAVAALQAPSFVDGYRRTFAARRKLATEIFANVPGVRFSAPQAGLMLWLDTSSLGNSRDVADHIAQKARIIVHPGENFGGIGSGYIRIMLSALRDDIAFADALRRTADCLGSFDPQN